MKNLNDLLANPDYLDYYAVIDELSGGTRAATPELVQQDRFDAIYSIALSYDLLTRIYYNDLSLFSCMKLYLALERLGEGEGKGLLKKLNKAVYSYV